jgi:hypothetical protein
MRRFLAPEPEGPVAAGKSPSFSVLIRTYQAADSVAEAVESALAQTQPPFEVVVYDDGSTDGTEDVLRPYRDRIVYLWRENAGAPLAFNRAVEAARGEFVVVLDADDAYQPERLEALGELASARPDLDIVTTDAAWESGGRVIGRFNGDGNRFEVDDQRGVILDRCFILAPALRREAVVAVGGHDPQLPSASDWDCWLRMILNGSKAGSVDEPLHRYRLREDSLSDDRLSAFRERVTLLENLRTEPALLPDDRDRLELALARHRRTLAVAEACEAARRGAGDARVLALAVAREPGHGRRMRAKAAALAAAPAALRPWLVDRLEFPSSLARREVGGSG